MLLALAGADPGLPMQGMIRNPIRITRVYVFGTQNPVEFATNFSEDDAMGEASANRIMGSPIVPIGNL
jgi:hypothetical protein